jgi:hypothetical protein
LEKANNNKGKNNERDIRFICFWWLLPAAVVASPPSSLAAQISCRQSTPTVNKPRKTIENVLLAPLVKRSQAVEGSSNAMESCTN